MSVATFSSKIIGGKKPFCLRKKCWWERNEGGFKSDFWICKKIDGRIRSNSSHYHHIVGHCITSLMTYYSITCWIWFLIKTQQFSPLPFQKQNSHQNFLPFWSFSLLICKRVLVKSLFEHSNSKERRNLVIMGWVSAKMHIVCRIKEGCVVVHEV